METTSQQDSKTAKDHVLAVSKIFASCVLIGAGLPALNIMSLENSIKLAEIVCPLWIGYYCVNEINECFFTENDDVSSSDPNCNAL